MAIGSIIKLALVALSAVELIWFLIQTQLSRKRLDTYLTERLPHLDRARGLYSQKRDRFAGIDDLDNGAIVILEMNGREVTEARYAAEKLSRLERHDRVGGSIRQAALRALYQSGAIRRERLMA